MAQLTEPLMMVNSPLRTAAIYCLALWVAIWVLFLLMRFSPIDIREIPGAGKIALTALGIVFAAPILATLLAAAALVRKPRTPLSWLTLGFAISIVFGQVGIFLITRWL
jgi:hypothetical protein